MRQIGQWNALRDAPMQQLVDPGYLARPKFQGVGTGAQVVRESGDKEYQLSRFVARIAGAMAEIHARGTQRPRAPQNGRADALNGFRGCVG
jgi:hypothetical protein